MFEWLWPTLCLGCGVTDRGRWCSDCLPGTVLRPPCSAVGIRAAFAVERYDRPAGQVLQSAKRRRDRPAACALAALAADRLAPALESALPFTIVPVPSGWRSRLRRGFAVPPLLSARLAKRLRAPVCDALVNRNPHRLATLDAAGRREAIRGMIRARRDVDGRVVLVDDVLTTGATAEACSLELLGGTTREVLLATIAAVPRQAGTNNQPFDTYSWM